MAVSFARDLRFAMSYVMGLMGLMGLMGRMGEGDDLLGDDIGRVGQS